MSEEVVELRNQIAEAMRRSRANSHFYVMETAKHHFRRFHFNHAKYMVIDDKDLLIGSENYSGHLDAPTRKPGNRGWVTLLHRPESAQEYKAMFQKDADGSRDDVHDLV